MACVQDRLGRRVGDLEAPAIEHRHVFIHMCIDIGDTYTFFFIYIYIYIFVSIYIYTHAFVYYTTCKYAYVCMYVCIYIYVCTCKKVPKLYTVFEHSFRIMTGPSW